MANDVQTTTLFDGSKRVIVLLHAELDTADEANAVKVDVSGLDPVPTTVQIEKIKYSITDGLSVQLFWDATSPELFMNLGGGGEMDLMDFPIANDAGTGVTGDIKLSTLQYSAAGDGYTIVLYLRKKM